MFPISNYIIHTKVVGDKFRHMTWPLFVDMLINDDLEKHSWLANIRGATSTIDPTGELHGTKKIKSSDKKSKKVTVKNSHGKVEFCFSQVIM